MSRNATRQKQVDFKPACKAMQVVKLFHILEHLKKTQALKSEHSFENGPFFWARGITTWRMTEFSSSLLSRSLKRCYWHFYLHWTSNMIHLLGLSAKKTKLFTYSLWNAHEQNLLQSKQNTETFDTSIKSASGISILRYVFSKGYSH